jgi:hypothetical protein
MTDRRKKGSNGQHEDDVSAEEAAKAKGTWFSQKNVDEKRAQRAEAPAVARAEETFRIGRGRWR